jgi:uncharacterized membrane protein
VTDRSAKKHWKGWLFYCNPQDPELVIPRPNGLGYTLNFARREAWIMIGILLSLPLVIVLVTLVAVLVR